MDDQGEKKILLVNGFDQFGKGITARILETYPKYSLYIIGKNVDEDSVNKYTNQNNIKLVNHGVFFKDSLEQEVFNIIIYNALPDNNANTDTSQSSNNFTNLLTKATKDHADVHVIVPLNDLSPYMNSLISETSNASNTSGLRTQIIEVGDIYGPGMDLGSHRPIDTLLSDAVTKPEIILQSISTFRYYIFIDDALSGFMQILPLQQGGTFTLANSQDISASALALRIGEIVNKRVVNRQSVSPEDHVKSLADMIPYWKPQISIEEGLERTLTWLKNIQESQKQPSSFEVHSIADAPIAPIRNYQPTGIVEKLQHDPPQTDTTPLYKVRTTNLRSLDDIKSRLNLDEQPAPLQQPERVITIEPAISKPEAPKIVKPEKIKTPFFTKKRMVITSVVAVFGVLLYIFLLVPIFWTAFSYYQLSSQMSHTTEANAQSLSNDATNLHNSFLSLAWIFTVTKQDQRYNNFLQTTQTLEDITSGQQAFLTYQSDTTTFKNDFVAQNSSASSAMKTLSQQKGQSGIVVNGLTIATNDLNTYNAYLPTDATTLKSHLNTDMQSIPGIENEANLLVTLFNGKKTYLLVVDTKNISSYTSAGDPTITAVTYDNGKFTGKTSITSNTTASATTFDDYATQLQTNISQHSDGVIFVSASINQTLQQANDAFSSPSTFLSTLFNTTSSSTTNQVAMDLEEGNISIYLDNVLLSKDAIINAIT